MATAAPHSSPMFSFHMETDGLAVADGSILPPTTTMPIADKDLIFVHLNEVTGPIQDTDTRHKVRAHVMRDFQRKKHKFAKAKPNKSGKGALLTHQESSLDGVQAQQLEAPFSGKTVTEAEAPPEEAMAVMHFPDPQAIGMLEPFNTLPIPGSPRLQLLMHHCGFRTIILILQN
tara:strand:+ start:1032 stop:1553 length:522 start_codon:yes stop_codon:yes gene_type:complete